MRILLIRYAQSLGQEPDADLSQDGHAQALALASRLTALGIGNVFSSPYRRAIATVAPFAAQAGIDIQIVEDLRERKLAQGWLPDFMLHIERSFADENYCLNGGESLAMTAARGLRGLGEVARNAGTSCPVIASHGNLIASILRTIDGEFGFEMWKAMRNPHVFELELKAGRPVSFRDLEVTR